MTEVLSAEELDEFRRAVEEAEAGVGGNLWAESADLIFRGGNGEAILVLGQAKRLLATIAADRAELERLRTALEKAIEDMQWMFGGWGVTDEDQLAVGRVTAHRNISELRAALVAAPEVTSESSGHEESPC